MANLLAAETSPYLRQHRDNPVHWRPWGEEALQEARAADRPLLVSVGYSTCHWCHVMERESFEDPEIAAYMNEHFVNVKVDREERPDVDALYMEALQGMTGHGGWPMTVFCDPDGVPFHAGTYFPPEPAGGMPSFRMVLEAVSSTFGERRDEIRERAPKVAEQLGALGRLGAGERPFDTATLEEAVSSMMRRADQANGGFGGAPKFPPASALEFLLDHGRESFVELSLDRMMSGGMYDQLGGGFARYSVDAVWMVPHFEKMLYDNALLARLYLHGWQRFGRERYRRVCTETLDWALREMRDVETGGFHSALDADSEGVEGRFYVWDETGFREALTGDGLSDAEIDEVVAYFGVTEAGNFEGTNVLRLAHGPSDRVPEVVERARPVLFEARAKRVWPSLDDKVLASWNGLMIAALAEAGAVLGEDRYIAAAIECAEAIVTHMRDESGGLLRTMSGGEARIQAFLEDYAYLVESLVVLYEVTFDSRWYEEALELAETMIERFHDSERGAFFTTAEQGELIARRKDLGDHPIPAGNSAAALGLLRLSALSADSEMRTIAVRSLQAYAEVAVRNADSFGHMLQAAALSVRGTRELALVAPSAKQHDDGEPANGDGERGGRLHGRLGELLGVAWEAHRPDLVRAGGHEGTATPPLLSQRTAREGRPTAYLCRDFTCREPVTEAELLRAQMTAG